MPMTVAERIGFLDLVERLQAAWQDGQDKVDVLTGEREVFRALLCQKDKRITELRTTLESVEWIDRMCPWCLGFDPRLGEDGGYQGGHKPDCQRQAALAAKEP